MRGYVCRGTRCVMVIVLGNGHIDQNSNTGQNSFHFA